MQDNVKRYHLEYKIGKKKIEWFILELTMVVGYPLSGYFSTVSIRKIIDRSFAYLMSVLNGYIK